MILLSAIIGLGAATLLLAAGYLLGAKRGHGARELLRQQNSALVADMKRLPDSPPNEQDDSLRATIQQLLTPLVQRERLSHELAHLETQLGQGKNLTTLLDQIAEKGNFEAVLLGDEAGWPLAASGNTRDIERWGATTSLLLLLAERMSRDSAPAPLALMVLDEANKVTLCRLFRASDQRLTLTAASTGAQLTPTALDPALVKVSAALSNRGNPGD